MSKKRRKNKLRTDNIQRNFDRDVTREQFDAGESFLYWNSYGAIILFTLPFIWLLMLDEGILQQPKVYWMTAYSAWGLYVTLIRYFIRKHRLKTPHKLLTNEVLYQWPFGIQRRHSYEQWADSVRRGHFNIGRRGFEFRLGLEKLTFFYNVGSLNERRKTEISYERFRKHLLDQDSELDRILPVLTKENTDLLDKRFFYHRSRRNQLLVLICNMVFFYTVFDKYDSQSVIVAAVICGIVESFAFYFLLKGAYYHYKNEMKIRKDLPDRTGLVRDRGLGAFKPYWGYVYLILVFALNYFLQYIDIMA